MADRTGAGFVSGLASALRLPQPASDDAFYAEILGQKLQDKRIQEARKFQEEQTEEARGFQRELTEEQRQAQQEEAAKSRGQQSELARKGFITSYISKKIDPTMPPPSEEELKQWRKEAESIWSGKFDEVPVAPAEIPEEEAQVVGGRDFGNLLFGGNEALARIVSAAQQSAPRAFGSTLQKGGLAGASFNPFATIGDIALNQFPGAFAEEYGYQGAKAEGEEIIEDALLGRKQRGY